MAGPRYRADPPALRRTLALDGLKLIFHRPSGATHVVAPPVPELLDALGRGAADAAELRERLAETHDLGPDAEAAIAARLVELEAAGLIVRA